MISHAEIAIKTRRTVCPDGSTNCPEYNGGIIIGENARFLNNGIATEIAPYPDPSANLSL